MNFRLPIFYIFTKDGCWCRIVVMSEEMALQDFGNTTVRRSDRSSKGRPEPTPDGSDRNSKDHNSTTLVQWANCGPSTYKPVSTTFEKLDCGVYSVNVSQYHGVTFTENTICVDDLLRFPDSLSERILAEITTFWSKGSKFKEHGFLHRRGYLLHGPAGCHVKGTKVIMFDGLFKNVEDIVIGDLLMGPDSKPRKVLELKRGIDEMIKVSPIKGDPFVVNQDHILHLKYNGNKTLYRDIINDNGYVDISVKDYLSKSGYFKARTKLIKTNALQFKTKKLIVPPYILGLWLGDGSADRASIVNIDKEVIKSWKEYIKSQGLIWKKYKIRHSAVVNYNNDYKSRINKNSITEKLKTLGVLNNKNIPSQYLLGDEFQRLELLAGLIDSDGCQHDKCLAFSNINENLVDGILFLARSLGLAAYKHKRTCHWKYKGEKRTTPFHTVNITGNTSIVPSRLKRKMCGKRKINRDALRTGFSIEPVGIGEYYGFMLSDDHLYLTSDFIIHHNSGKTCLVQQIIADIVNADGLVFLCNTHPSVFNDGLSLFRKVEPVRPIVCLMEDIDAIIDEHGEDEILTLLDGENQIDRVLNIACPAPETLILKSDLTWDKAENLKVGDELIAFDENPIKGWHVKDRLGRKFRTSIVTSTGIITKPRFRVTTDTGTTIVVSEKHPFLIKPGENKPALWKYVDELKIGDNLYSIGKPWKTDSSYEAGYIAGQFDAEGSLNIYKSAKNNRHVFKASWTQSEGPLIPIVELLLNKMGFDFSTYKRKRQRCMGGGLVKKSRYYKQIHDVQINGGRWGSLRLTGTVRPVRFLLHPKLKNAWEDVRVGSGSCLCETAISIEKIEDGPVIALNTSTKTFIGEGLLQHNTTNYPEKLDRRLVARPRRFDRVIKIGMPGKEIRRVYFNKKLKVSESELDKWVAATEGFSFAACAELVISVCCFEKPFESAVKDLDAMMTTKISSSDYNSEKLGFGGGMK